MAPLCLRKQYWANYIIPCEGSSAEEGWLAEDLFAAVEEEHSAAEEGLFTAVEEDRPPEDGSSGTKFEDLRIYIRKGVLTV